MTDAEGTAMEAKPQPIKKISKIWFIPILAICIGGWMLYHTWANQGPLINIAFETAEGIEVENTKIKLRDIVIGKVVEVKLNEEFDGIIATARLDKSSESLLRKDSQFWVVKPRIGQGGITGLSTILSGVYIVLSPGKDDESSKDFVGLEDPPVTPAGTPGLFITLDSTGQNALDIGDPILYRGIEVGQIEYVHFNHYERVVYYNAFIESPYDELITTNTRFWEVNGIQLEVSADGIRAETGTLETFIGGGVTFDVPANLPLGEVIKERAFFTIYPSKDAVRTTKYKNAVQYILLFSQSIRGLRPGAPVEYKGVRIGSVLRTDINYEDMGSLLDKRSLIPVKVSIEPARLGLADDPGELAKVEAELSQWISEGLHGFISSGNLITGSKFVELRYVGQATTENQSFEDIRVIPTAASELDRLFEKVGSFVDTLEQLPLPELVDTFDGALKEMDTAMIEFADASGEFDDFLEGAKSDEVITQVNETLKSVDQLARGFSEGSKTHQEIQSTISSLDQVLRELAPLLSQLNRKPNSLIFTGEEPEENQPKARKDNNNE